ncbi:MAG TPA: bifunctional RNase H/acid phosphatase [Jiangellales bacterium]|nr:bifunctional RNase H/acid phosphatase [Jiangellales bacterium]
MTRRLVIEADGGSRGNPGPAAYGAVVRDADTGAVLAERAQAIGTASNNVAEYRGLIAGLEAVHEIDPDAELEVRMDSKLVVEQMSGRWKIKHPDMKPLALRAQRLAPADTTYRWIPRELNSHADRLLNDVLDLETGRGKRGRAAATPPAAPPSTAPPAAVPPSAEEPAHPPVTAATIAARPDLGPPSTLLLLRHGATDHTLARRFSGSGGADPGLSDLGVEQVTRAAAYAAAHTDLSAVVTSPLRRCRETAQVVAERLDLPVRVDEGWSELAFGEWDGLTFAEVRERWPAELDAWLASPETAPPGGEPLSALDRRVQVARDRTLARHPGRTVLVVTHMTPIRALVRSVLGAPLSALPRLDLAPASYTEIAHWSDGLAALRGFNVLPR